MKAIVLLGPTGVGKTDISLKIYNGDIEIISADSVQVYKYLDIGSSKPDPEVRKNFKHHLIDIVDPDFHFTAGNFCEFAKNACNDLTKRNKVPLFVGGTAFYIDAFFQGLSAIPEVSESVRNQLKDDLNKYGLKHLYDELGKYDLVFSNKIHSNDKQRILRGLEVYRGTGKPLSSYYDKKIGYESEDTKYIGLCLDREFLKKRIDKRVDCMIQSGFIEEVQHLRQMGYGPDLNSMQTIGYLELNKYIDGELKLDQAIEKIKTETKKYAKRQMTWFKRNKKIQWFESLEILKIQDSIKKIFSDWERK